MIIMSNVEIIKDESLTSISGSAPTKMSHCWQSGHQRTQILVLIQRRHRERFEKYSSTLELKHPCWAVFYRPRSEADEIEDNGLDPKSASFMFLDIALEDLGRWVGPLIKDEWTKEEVIVTPSRNVDEFTPTKWTTFRDPWLDLIETLPLAKSPTSIQGKVWVTYPSSNNDTQTSNSKQQTNVDSDFAGKIAGFTHSFGQENIPKQETEIASKPVQTTETTPFVMPTSPVSIPNLGGGNPKKSENLSTKTETKNENLSAINISPQPVEVEEKEVVSNVTINEQKPDDLPPKKEENDPELEVHEELLETIKLLKAGGLEAEQILDSPAFQEVSERATAAGLDVWNIFISNAN